MNNSAAKTIPQILKDNICTVFNLLNLLIALSLAAVGAWKNMLFIIVIIINTAVGIIQEIKAKRQIEKLSAMTMPKIKAMRSGKELFIPAEKLEKGDIITLESGCAVCCDCKIISGSIEVNESVLTGESEPVAKCAGGSLLSGSSVISGKCAAVVTCGNAESFAAKITYEVKNTKESGSEMLLSMKKVTKFTGFFIVPIGILMLMQSVFLRNAPIPDAVVATSAGLLGMLPKGLVLLISIGFATGVINLSKKNVLVRRLHSLENLARCDVLCLDKTGTLTEGKLTVEKVFNLTDEGEFNRLMSTYLNNTHDNNSTFTALKNHFNIENPYSTTASVPFYSDRKYSAVTLENGEIFVIGAPEKLSAEVPENIREFMTCGKRVILTGLCRGEILPENISVTGFIVISDKVKKNAPETLKYFYSQGVDVKIISGDNPLSAVATAKVAGVRKTEQYIDMSTVNDDEIENIAEKYTVFGRVTPNQKKLLITALQNCGHKAAMTGDGVNDLLAMRRADCSIAMGTGCDAAKQTAQLVLLNSDFSVLKDVISQGRRVINNLTKSAGVFFIKTIYSVLLCVLCLLFNRDFPFIPIQITLIDAVIEAIPAFFMSFEANDKKCDEGFLSSALHAALSNGIAVFICCMALLIISGHAGIDAGQSSLLMYLSVGFISLAGVVKAGLPFNIRRGVLALTSIFAFVCAVALFSGFLQLPRLSPAGAAIFPFVLIPGFALSLLITKPEKVL